MDTATINIIKDLIATVGFPVFVALYLLIRMESVIKNLTNTISKNNETLVKLCDRLGEKNG